MTAPVTIEIPRGTTRTVTLTITRNGAAVPLRQTGYQLHFYAGLTEGDVPVITKSWVEGQPEDAGITVRVAPNDHIADVTIEAADTEMFTAAEQLPWEAILNEAEKLTRVAHGQLDVPL